MEQYTSDPVALRMVARYHSAKLRALPHSDMTPSDTLAAIASHKAKLAAITARLVALGHGTDIRKPEAWRT